MSVHLFFVHTPHTNTCNIYCSSRPTSGYSYWWWYLAGARRLAVHRNGYWSTSTLRLLSGHRWRNNRYPMSCAAHIWIHRPGGHTKSTSQQSRRHDLKVVILLLPCTRYYKTLKKSRSNNRHEYNCDLGIYSLFICILWMICNWINLHML